MARIYTSSYLAHIAMRMYHRNLSANVSFVFLTPVLPSSLGALPSPCLHRQSPRTHPCLIPLSYPNT